MMYPSSIPLSSSKLPQQENGHLPASVNPEKQQVPKHRQPLADRTAHSKPDTLIHPSSHQSQSLQSSQHNHQQQQHYQHQKHHQHQQQSHSFQHDISSGHLYPTMNNPAYKNSTLLPLGQGSSYSAHPKHQQEFSQQRNAPDLVLNNKVQQQLGQSPRHQPGHDFSINTSLQKESFAFDSSTFDPTKFPSIQRTKKNAGTRSSVQFGDISPRNTDTSSLTSIETPAGLNAKSRNRYSTGYISKPIRVKGNFSPEPNSSSNDEIPPVPPLPEDVYLGKHSLSTKQSHHYPSGNRVSMVLPTVSDRSKNPPRKLPALDPRSLDNTSSKPKSEIYPSPHKEVSPQSPSSASKSLPRSPISVSRTLPHSPVSSSGSGSGSNSGTLPLPLPAQRIRVSSLSQFSNGLKSDEFVLTNNFPSPDPIKNAQLSTSSSPPKSQPNLPYKTIASRKSTGSFHIPQTSRVSSGSMLDTFPAELQFWPAQNTNETVSTDLVLPPVPKPSRFRRNSTPKTDPVPKSETYSTNSTPNGNPSRLSKVSIASQKEIYPNLPPQPSPSEFPPFDVKPQSPRTRQPSIGSAISTDTNEKRPTSYQPSKSREGHSEMSPRNFSNRSRKNSCTQDSSDQPSVPVLPQNLQASSSMSQSPKLASPGTIKSQAMADIASSASASASPALEAKQLSSPRRLNFSSLAKSPYRPVYRPSQIYPQSNKKAPPPPEDDVADKSNLLKIRSKSTVAKQWTSISTSLNSSSAKRLLLSPFSSEYRKATQKEKSAVPSQEPIPKNALPLSKRVDISPGKDIEDRTEEEKEIQNIMKHLVKTLPEEDRMAKRYEEAKQNGLIKDAMTPSLAARSHRLNIYERGEILDYRNVYFCGKPGIKKISGDIRHAINNYGFDDSNGDYHVVPGDHIAYRYEILGVLGKGSFGKVLKCVDHKTGKLVAVKLIINRKRFHIQALVEADILRVLSQWDPQDKYHLVRYTSHFNFREHLCISTELLGINLYELIKLNKFKGLPIKLVRHFTKQLLEGLRFLDYKEIIHCDLKPENILLSDPNRGLIKIIDFGSSCYESEKVYTYIQSRFYRSPEVILGMVYNQRIDVWSLGCIVAELITGHPLFMGENEQEQISCIMEIFGVPEKSMITQCSRRKLFFDSVGTPRPYTSSKNVTRYPGAKSLKKALKSNNDLLIDFLSQCLIWNPRNRMAPYQGLRHEFITGVPLHEQSHPASRKPSHSSIHSSYSSNIPIYNDNTMTSTKSFSSINSSGSSNSSYHQQPQQQMQRQKQQQQQKQQSLPQPRPLPTIPSKTANNGVSSDSNSINNTSDSGSSNNSITPSTSNNALHESLPLSGSARYPPRSLPHTSHYRSQPPQSKSQFQNSLYQQQSQQQKMHVLKPSKSSNSLSSSGSSVIHKHF
jgi:dual specificity tyrosine-phosphorylation-regulated kinase 2/3/4